MKASILEQLTPKHLLEELETTDSMKESVEASVRLTEVADGDKADPRDQKEWTFQFSWKDGRGKLWEGQFTNKILSIAEQQRVAIFEAQLAGGLPFESLDTGMRNINHAVAHMSYSLVKKPSWANDLRQLLDPSLVIALYLEVASHEARFFGLN